MPRTALNGLTISDRSSHIIKLAEHDAALDSLQGSADEVLTASPGGTLSAHAIAHFVETTGTVTGALPDGTYAGQLCEVVQSVAASTPVGTVTGHFKTQAGVAKATLALGTAVGLIFRGRWDGAAWREVDALGGTGSSLS